jgi:hypothetical protein
MSTTEQPPATWSVRVLDMFNYMDSEDGEETVAGFLQPEDAIEYARRRMRSSLEEQRPSAVDAEDLRDRWFSFGEDCIAIGTGYKALEELDYFIAHPATPNEIDWVALEPDRTIRELRRTLANKDGE